MRREENETRREGRHGRARWTASTRVDDRGHRQRVWLGHVRWRVRGPQQLYCIAQDCIAKGLFSRQTCACLRELRPDKIESRSRRPGLSFDYIMMATARQGLSTQPQQARNQTWNNLGERDRLSVNFPAKNWFSISDSFFFHWTPYASALLHASSTVPHHDAPLLRVQESSLPQCDIFFS